jgi:hypothetical protein
MTNSYTMLARAGIALTMAAAAYPAAAQWVPDAPTGPIEKKYYADGPFEVVTSTTSTACDSKGNICDIWAPKETGTSPKRPLVLWANGTSDTPVTPDKYGYWLKHLASWGFVVVATRDGKTGYGNTLLDVLGYMHKEDESSGSPFYSRIDFSNVGSAGHSQGATGAANAMLKSGGRIKTAVSFNLPAQIFCSPADNCLLTPDLAGATTGSYFIVSGTLDPLAPDHQLGGTQLNSETAYYEATPSSLTKAKGMLIGPSHNDIVGTPACGALIFTTCLLGTYGFLGFPTAWLAWHLQGAEDGAAAFRRGSGEFFTAHAWTGQRSNVR